MTKFSAAALAGAIGLTATPAATATFMSFTEEGQGGVFGLDDPTRRRLPDTGAGSVGGGGTTLRDGLVWAGRSSPSADALAAHARPAFSDAAVPEPATWALMIGGFGVAGLAIRRHNRNRRGVRIEI